MKTKKAFTGYCMALALVFLLSGCGASNDISTYLSNCSVKSIDDYSTVKGTVHLNGDSANIVYMDCTRDKEVSIEYSLTRDKGDLQVYYQSPTGADKLIVDTTTEKGDLIEGECTVSLGKGEGKIYFTEANSIFDFSMKLNVSDDILQYFDMVSQKNTEATEKKYDNYEKSLNQK